MPILSEYAITHCVFDASSYDSQEIGRLHLQYLKEALLNEAVVRDLRNGSWSNVINSEDRSWHIMGKELLKKLRGRLIPFPSVASNEPQSDFEWCQEALFSHKVTPLAGVISSLRTAQEFKQDSLVAPVQKLPSSAWWQKRSPSIRIRRCKEDYAENLRPLFRSANSIMFIDPHLDPSKPRYHDFISLLGEINQLERKPLIEIHRCCYHGSGKDREWIGEEETKKSFQTKISELIGDLSFKLEVFIWDNFHDRHIISNIIGLNLGNGLDTTKSGDKTVWCRIGRKDRDDVQREFDTKSGIHKLKYSFSL